MPQIVSCLIMFCLPFILSGQLSRGEIRSYASQVLPSSIVNLNEFLTLANNGRIPEEQMQNLSWCQARFESLGFETELAYSDSIPHLLAKRVITPTAKSVLFYLQIDGQPVDVSEWNQSSPFEPVLKRKIDQEWKVISMDSFLIYPDPEVHIFARSSSDSKGPAMAFITALEILKSKNILPEYNIKVIMDFQEELGSPTLPALVQSRPELFEADFMLIMDGTRHLSNLPTLTFGARGIATVTLRVFGPLENLHSGQYGNYAPNPVFKLARLLADMKDTEGRVLIPGFYDGITLSENDKMALNSLPENKEEIISTLGFAEPDHVGETYQESLQYPSLNVRGLRAAWIGNEVRTIIPSEAIAEIDMRLVPETEGERMITLMRTYVANKGFYVLDRLPTDSERSTYANLVLFTYRIGSRPFRTEMDSELGNWLTKSMERIFDDQFVKMRSTGGSQPISPFITTLGLPAVSIRIPNPDNNIHGPDENIRIGNYLEGIQMCLSILTQPID